MMKKLINSVTELLIPMFQGGTLSRAVAVLICMLIIIIRAVWPNLRFDDVSLWLFVTAVLVLLIPDIGNLINRIKKFKKGDLEIEFEQSVDQLAEETEELEEEVESESEEEGLYEGLPEKMRTLLRNSAGNPRGALISLAVEIEAELRSLAEEYGSSSAYQASSPSKLVQDLVQNEILSPKVAHIFRDFWSIRNQAVHSRVFEVSEARLFQLVDLGLKLLKILRFQGGASSSSSPSQGPQE